MKSEGLDPLQASSSGIFCAKTDHIDEQLDIGRN